MYRRDPSRLPAISTLIAFETTARLGSFSKAAKELRTAQPAISRHIVKLETQLSARLFERSRAGVRLTDAGSRFQDAVARSLDIIQAAAAEAAERATGDQVVLAFLYKSSHAFMAPRYDALQRALGKQVHIAILNHYGDNMPQAPSEHPIADVVFTWDAADAAPQDRTTVLKEAVKPLCSPGYAEVHGEILNGPVRGWGGLTFLEFTSPRQVFSSPGGPVPGPRTSWEDWFEVAGRPEQPPRFKSFDSYVYVLEMAAAGHGIALGWRGFVERHLETGALVELADEFVETDGAYYCVLTERGRRNPLARKCLEFFDHWE